MRRTGRTACRAGRACGWSSQGDARPHLVKLRELLRVVADVEVGGGLLAAKLEGGQVVRERGLVLLVEAAQVDLLARLGSDIQLSLAASLPMPQGRHRVAGLSQNHHA